MSEVARRVETDDDLYALTEEVHVAVIDAIDDELDDDRTVPCDVSVSVDADAVDPALVDEESDGVTEGFAGP